MEVAELRIGNIVFDPNQRIMVLTSAELVAALNEAKLKPHNTTICKPVAVTASTLENLLGFEQSPKGIWIFRNNGVVMRYRLNSATIGFSIKSSVFIGSTDDDGDEMIWVKATAVRFIHQLQNLYYSMYKTELTMREPTIEEKYIALGQKIRKHVEDHTNGPLSDDPMKNLELILNTAKF